MPPTYPHHDLKYLVCDTFQIQDLFVKSRKTEHVVARSVYFSLLREKNYSYPRLSQLSKLDHSTIYHSVNRFDLYYDYYYEYKSNIDYIVSEWAATKTNFKN